MFASAYQRAWPAPVSKPEPALRLEEMSWEERFVATWEALCKMECRAERAEARVIEMERLCALRVLQRNNAVTQ